MKKLELTASSCAPHVAEIAGMSLATQEWLYAKDDELQRLQGIDAKRAARMRAVRTAEREALVLTAIHAKKARLEKELRCHWTSTLMTHYFDKRGITIDEETVRRVVKHFPGF